MLLNILLIVIILLILIRNKKKTISVPINLVKSETVKKDEIEVVVRPNADKPQSIDERASYYYGGEKPMDGDGVSDEDRRWYDTVFNGGTSTKNELAMCNCGSSSDENCGCGKTGYQK